MSYPSARALGRQRMQEVRMDSRCTVWHNTGRTAQDDETDYEGALHEASHRDLPLRIKPGRSQTITLGDSEYEQAQAEAHVPAATRSLHDGDLLEVTAGESEGVWLRIVEAVLPDGRTARRMPVEMVDRPEDFMEAP